jgi:RHS repeat-associated protein
VTDNGSAVAYTTNNLNEYSAKGATSLTYDANGNLTSNSPWTNTFDAQNRLVSTSSASGGISIAYDARNRPVKRVGGTALLPVSAVSRKTHGGAGDFDINLPLTGAAGIECRSGGGNNAHQLIVTFPRAITFAGASVTTGTGTVASTNTSPDGKQLTINLTNVTNAQTIVVTLTDVTDGTIMNDVIVGMGVLFSDVSGNGIVSNTDVAQCQGQVGGTVSASNFRSDVNVNGIISNTDVSLIRSQVGGGLPSSPPLSQTPPTMYFAYDGWNLIEEHSATGSELARYVHGVRTDELLVRTTTAGTFYYHHDALGSTIALTDSTGNVIERYSYDVYGAPTFEDGNGNAISNSASGNRFLFTGREYLVELGLYDYRNRAYSQNLGRFLQTDPLRFEGKEKNLYRYVFNSVSNLIDPFGLGCICDGNGHWHYESGTVSPNRSDFPSGSAGDAAFINAETTSYIDKSTSDNGRTHGCYSCDQDGKVLVNQDCIDKERDCTMVARLRGTTLSDDYPDSTRCDKY